MIKRKLKKFANACFGKVGLKFIETPYLKRHMNFVFMHIPKCGGTSIDDAVRQAAGWSDAGRIDPLVSRLSTNTLLDTKDPNIASPYIWEYRQFIFISYLVQGQPIISGHFTFSESAHREYGSKYFFFTILRDPVERWISHYLFNKFTNNDPTMPPCIDCKMEPDEELHNVMSSYTGKFMAQYYCAFFGGYNSRTDFDHKDTIRAAKANIQKFNLIGFLDNLPTFQEKFREKTDLNLHIKTLNKTSDKKITFEQRKQTDKLFNNKIKDEIRLMCQEDYRLLMIAQDRFLSTP